MDTVTKRELQKERGINSQTESPNNYEADLRQAKLLWPKKTHTY